MLDRPKLLSLSCRLKRRSPALPVLLSLLVAVSAPLVPPGATPAVAQGLEDAITLLDEEVVPSGYGTDFRAYRALSEVQDGHFIRAREIAEEMLAEDSADFAGHFVLGIVLHRAEGSLPRALFHLQRSRELLEARFGPEPASSTPWRWHALTLAELAFVAGSMGRHEDKIGFLEERDALYQPPWPADRGWPLMRLRRYDEARRAAMEGLLLVDDLNQQEAGRTALCAIEAEQHRRQEAYDACREAADFARRIGARGPTAFTNASEAALGMLKLDEAERSIIEGTRRFAVGTVSNPWMDLTLLYLGQGRTAEALDALREMFRWRDRQPAFVDVQNRSEIDMAAVSFLLAAGVYDKAVTVTNRILERPDRTGFTSSESEQMAAAAAILDRLAHRLRAAELIEKASWQPWHEALGSRLEAARQRFEGWLSGRRAAAEMADERILIATLRPYLAGSVEMPEWIEGELVEILGPGVVDAALAQARQAETLPAATGYLDAFAAEVALVQGRGRAAMDLAELASAGLPSSELLIRARMMAVGARAALDVGARGRALGFLDRALQIDPGIVRRFDLALPVTIEAAPDAIARKTASLLAKSPRFTRAASGFRIRVSGESARGEACLLGTQGSVLACAQVTPRAGDDATAMARRLAAELHARAFAPRVDLTQADLRSLDGSPTAAGRSADRLRTVLDDVVE